MDPKKTGIHLAAMAGSAFAAYKFLPGNMRERAIGAVAAALAAHLITGAVISQFPSLNVSTPTT